MLGGMALPFFQGILLYDEGFTFAKAICLLCITLALISTIEKSEKKRGTVFYIAIFILNGMSGVLSKLFIASDLPKISAAGYSVWCAAATALLSGIVWGILSVSQWRKSYGRNDIAPKEET